ncbi:MAG: penicillin-binding protein activator LpoB [Chitinispirillales bacterium]|jgi:TolB-like protein|nr:penicillin-binding protein activator LpoB [Chitinispirillales bacterium]
MKKLTLLLIMLFSVSVFAQDLPRIAVYVTGDVHDNEKRVLGTRMLASLVNSGRYTGIERSNAFLAEIEREQVRQRSGAIDDNQISELGRQFGVRYVCVADITPAFGAYQVSARVIDVETAVVVFIGESNSSLRTMEELTQVSDEVVKNMFGRQTGFGAAVSEPVVPQPRSVVQIEPARGPAKGTFWLGLGMDILGAGIISYGVWENIRVVDRVDNGEFSAAKNSVKNRNAAYAVGAAVLLGGVTIHIFF